MPCLNEEPSGKKMVQILVAVIAAVVLAGCATAPADTLLLEEGQLGIMRQVLERKDKIVFLSSGQIGRNKPVVVLLHGATDDPTEMMKILTEWRGQYNVLLYSYNYHRPVEQVAGDFVGEMKALRSEIERVQPQDVPAGDVTVVTYSYSAIVFRMAVIIADDRTLFSNVSLIQLVPTAGGSYLARSMGFPGLDALVSLASKPSAAVNPYGSLAKELWEGKGNRRFYEAINLNRMVSVILESDPHSLAGVRDENVPRRYKNGIGPNVIVIPKSAVVTHEYFPTEPAGLYYLRKALEWSRKKGDTVDQLSTSPRPTQTPLDVVFRSVPVPDF